MSKRIYCWNCKIEVQPVEYAKIKVKPVCPRCGCFYPEKPEIEAKLSLAQEEYLNNRTDENLAKLFEPLTKLTFNIICSKLKQSGKSEDPDKINDKVQWTLLKILSYYKDKPEFMIEGSFISYIGQVVLFPLYNKKDKEREVKEMSIYTPLDEKGAEGKRTLMDKYIEDNVVEIDDFIFREESKEHTIKMMSEIIATSIDVLYKQNKNFAECLNLVTLLYHYTSRKPDRFFSDWWRMSSISLRDNFNSCLEIIKKNLYRSLEGNI